MAKLLVTGVRTYSFKEDGTNRLVEGMSVFYKSKLEPRDKNIAAGYQTEKVNVAVETELYRKMAVASYDKPFEADFKYDIIPGRKRPVLLDIVF